MQVDFTSATSEHVSSIEVTHYWSGKSTITVLDDKIEWEEAFSVVHSPKVGKPC